MMPLTITASGLYRVTEDLRVTNTGSHGITVQAPDVSIDLRGYELRGPGQDAGCGIYQTAELAGLAVSNGTISAWQHGQKPSEDSGHGLLARGDANLVDNIQLLSNTVGAYVTGHSVISNCNVTA